jgi:hypothetical protein
MTRSRGVRESLPQERDPARGTSTAAKALPDPLAPNRADFIQGSFGAAVKPVVAEDGTLPRKAEGVDTEPGKLP